MGFLSIQQLPLREKGNVFPPTDREPSWSHELLDLYRQPGLREYAMKVSQHFGNSCEDAEDYYHDALLILHRQLAKGGYNGKCTLRTYFLSIVKWYALGKRRQLNNKPMLPLHPEQLDIQDEWADKPMLAAEKRTTLEDALGHLSERRQNLLHWWEEGLPMEEIAEKAGYKNADVAKKETWVSRKKLKNFVTERPFYRQMLSF